MIAAMKHETADWLTDSQDCGDRDEPLFESSSPGRDLFSCELYVVPVVGVRYSRRRAVAASLKLHDPLILHREPNNRHDCNAIAVLSQSYDKLGYIGRDLAQGLARKLDRLVHDMPAELVGQCVDPDGLGYDLRIRFLLPVDIRAWLCQHGACMDAGTLPDFASQ